MSNINREYTPTTVYDSGNVSLFNKLDELSEDSKDIKEQTEEFQEKTGVLDIIGDYFTQAYQALKIAMSSFSVFSSLGNEAVDKLPLGSTGGLFQAAFSTIIIVLLFVGILLAAIVKRDL